MTIPELLRAAAARIRQGWCQGNASDDKGGVCAIGAIEACIDNEALRWAARGEADDALMATLNLRFEQPIITVPDGETWGCEPMLHPIARWNDAPGQTAENVALGFEAAALFYEERRKQAIIATYKAEEAEIISFGEPVTADIS